MLRCQSQSGDATSMKSQTQNPHSVKVHIVLKERVRQSPKDCLTVLHELEDLAGISGVNEKRLQRYGIISGDVPTSKIEAVKALPGVESVSVDQPKYALGAS